MAGQASMISSSFSYQWKYDVFLSFRGIDTRRGFTGYLYKALKDKGIHTFIDDEELQRGEKITLSLVKAIEESRIAIPVFSENYASSSFCLDELVVILASIKEKGRMVLPVFYDVDPSDVRHQRGSYMKALANHEERFKDNKEKVNKWREALRQVADLSGYHLKKHGNENEYEFIGKIVKEISNKIIRAPLHAADYPIGLESRVLKVNSLLNFKSDGVHIVGIHGIGGIGKTTLARSVYNSIADQFEGLCFLDNVRENSIKYGLVHLQQTLLSEMVGVKDINLGSVSKGIPIIKDRIHQKKVLLALDDVDKLEQLRAIVGGPDWFDPGSRVIITTRDKHLLTSHGVNETYEVDGLNKKEALELISWNAFITNKVDPSYLDILNRALTYASGLPLALEVIGYHLCGRRMEEWESSLDQYKRIPNKDIQNILKGSFDSLEEDQQKFFLDIACCFKGYALSYVKKILCGHHGFCPEFGIGVLIEKSLIKINVDGHVTLHDLKNLKTLIIRNGCFFKGPELLPNSLRVLEWWRYPSPSLPSNFHPKNLVILELPQGCLMSLELLMSNKKFVNMRVLNFDDCQYITEIPGVSSVPNLEELSFGNCENLTKIHKSVGLLHKLKILNADGCSKLRSFPPIKLTSLEKLRLSYCHSLESFPEILEKMEKVMMLDIMGTPMNKIPISIKKLTRLQKLALRGCGIVELPSSIFKIRELRELIVGACEGLQISEQDEGEAQVSSMVFHNTIDIRLWHCNILDEFFQIGLLVFANVKRLYLHQVNLTILPACIKECRYLTEIYLEGCENLKDIRGIPPNNKKFSVIKCTSLKDLDFKLHACTSEEWFYLKEIYLEGCCNLQEIRGILPNIDKFSATQCASLKNLDFTLLACTEKCSSLKEIYLEGCNNLQEVRGIPLDNENFIGINCASLKSLDFTLLVCTKNCRFLKDIYLYGCENLQEIRGIPPNIKQFSVIKCTSLKDLDFKFHACTSEEWCYLKEIYLEGCCNLQEIRGILPNIDKFSAKQCASLKNLDFTLLACTENCSSLKEICLEGCENLPKIRGIPPNFVDLCLMKCTSLKDLDFTFLACTEEGCFLKDIYVYDCENLRQIRGIPSNIRALSVKGCTSLKDLDFTECCSLKKIYLNSCENLLEIRGIPSQIETISAINCTSLEELDFRLLQNSNYFKDLILENCKNLREIREIPPNIRKLSVIDCPSWTTELTTMFLNEELHKKGGKNCFIYQEQGFQSGLSTVALD